MPSRFVYSPKVFAYTRDASGTIWNLSDYVVSGEVQRLINQASTASVTLRNPQKKFTVTKGQAATFHPMDAITIFLQRLEGHPVQVFTGYLDETPYYQMYPGTITLTATCTLKKLLFMYFDPSLPYVFNLLSKMGWNYGATDGTLINYNALSQGTAKASDALQDAGIAKLLWTVLTDIGQWDDSHIWIEELPTGKNGIAARIAQLMATLSTETQIEAQEFTAFMNQLIGSGPQGSGGGSAGGGGTGVPGSLPGGSTGQKIFDYFTGQGLSAIGAAGIIGNWVQENSLSTDGAGLAQWGGGRFTALQAYAASANKPVTDLNVQLGFAWHELSTDYSSTLSGLQAATTASQAAIVFCNTYEETAYSSYGSNAAPGELTNVVNLQHRISAANDALATYGNSGKGTSLTTGNNPRGTAIAGASTSQTPSQGGQTTCIDAMISAAATINNKHYGYSKNGPRNAGIPSGSPLGFDCSAAVAAVLSAAGGKMGITHGEAVGSDSTIISELQAAGLIHSGEGKGTPECTLFDYPGQHIFMRLNGQYFGTEAGDLSGPVTELPAGNSSGGGWITNGTPGTANPWHFDSSLLSSTCTYDFSLGATSVAGEAAAGGGGAASSTMSFSNAEAFTGEIDFPSVQEMATAMILGNAHKGLMNDQQLLPFVQEVCQASLRSFQSLPNGDFYAFYPDYFGETDHRPPYWNIKDIEITNGGINLSDQSLVTHYFAVGDNTFPLNDALINALFSTGEITVYNAFLDQAAFIDVNAGTTVSTSTDSNGMADIMSRDEAKAFVQRYGARPQVSQFPMVRSPIYEMFLAYQGFLLAWSNQFQTPFTFTFMPELFPGGKVSFSNHGLQMYVQSVTHEWDFSEGGGFTTSAQLTAPAKMANASNDELPDNMVRALVEPIQMAKASSPMANKGSVANAPTRETSTEIVQQG